MDVRGNFTWANFILLLMLFARIMSKLFRCYKYLKIQFLAHLLALLANQPSFCLVIGLDGLVVNLAIGGAILMDREVVIRFSGCFL